MTDTLSIRQLREERGETLVEFGALVGIASKGRMSDIETGKAPCPLKVAVAIELLSEGRVRAETLNVEVALVLEAKAARGQDGRSALGAAA